MRASLRLKFPRGADHVMKLDEPLLEYDCTGKAFFQSGEEFNTDFSVKQLRDGTVAGSVTLLNMAPGASLKMGIADPGAFDLEGVEKMIFLTSN